MFAYAAEAQAQRTAAQRTSNRSAKKNNKINKI
jgi:hypothetical protein